MSKEPVRPAVWAVTIAVAFSYMGVGVVVPILPEISSALKASPGQTELLFSTYLFVSAALMFFASWVATRIGRKKPLLVGLAIIVTFAAACALSGHVDLIIGFRGGWGVGNALFVSTALATVLGASADPRRAIMLYEGASRGARGSGRSGRVDVVGAPGIGPSGDDRRPDRFVRSPG